MLNDKAKLGIGILAAVLITTAIMVPVSIYTDRAIHKQGGAYENPVQVWGYDDQVSSTAEKINDWMGITKTLTANIYGGQDAMSSEPTLLANSNYHTVEDDIQILDGVAAADEGLGYLSTAWISGYNETPLRTLSIYNPDAAAAREDEPTEPDTTNVANYIDPMADEDKGTYSETGLNSTLNMHMKVPVYIADAITISPDGPVIADPAGDAKTYFDNIAKEGYADDFAMQLGFFNWVATSAEADEYAKGSVMQGTVGGTDVFDEADWTALDTVYKTIGGKGELIDTVKAQQKDSSQYSINIDGTGTNTGLIQAEVEMYQDTLNKVLGTDLDLYYDLVNGGSGEGWKVSKADSGDDTSDARQNAFLGTQSRFPKLDEGAEVIQDFWGYDAATLTIPGELYTSPTEEHTGQVLGFTTGIDLAAFFVKNDMTFEYSIRTAEGANALGTEIATVDEEHHTINGFTIDGDKYEYGQTVKVKPTGITAEGARQIYEMGNSYENVLNQGLMIGEIVK